MKTTEEPPAQEEAGNRGIVQDRLDAVLLIVAFVGILLAVLPGVFFSPAPAWVETVQALGSPAGTITLVGFLYKRLDRLEDRLDSRIDRLESLIMTFLGKSS